MKKNAASQVIGVQMITAADGTAFTGSATVVITGDGGTQGASAGTGPTHEGNGFHTYLPTQGETNYDHIGFTFTGSGAIPVTVQVYTTFPQTGDNYARLGAPAGASIAADLATIDTVVDGIQTDLDNGTDGLGAIKAETALIVADTNELQTDWVNGGRLDLIIDAILADSGELQTDWANGGRLDLLVDAILADTGELQTDWVNGGRLDLILDAVAADAASLDNTKIPDVLSLSAIADSVWDETMTAHVTADSSAVHLKDILTDTAEIGTAGAGLTNINLPDQTMNITGDITGNLSGSVGSVTGAVGSVTGAVGSVTGSVGSVTGSVGSVTATVSADVVSISGDSAAADNLEASLETLFPGTASGGTTSTVTSAHTGYGDDTFIGRVLIFRTGALQYEAGVITDYDSASGLFTFAASTFTAGASASDAFVIV